MNFKYRIQQHIKENRWQYSVLVLLFLLGLILGNYQTFYLDSGVKSTLSEMVDNYLRGEQADSLSGINIWTGVFMNQAKNLFIIWFLGLTVIGLPLILALVIARGFSLGFTIGFLVHEKARAGVIMVLLSVVPHNLVYIPLIIVWSVVAMNFSIYLVRRRNMAEMPLSRSLAVYTSLLIVCMGFLAAGSLIEAYLSPWLLGLLL